MADTWWVLIPQGDQGQPASYLQQVDFRISISPGDPNYKLLQERKPVSEFGMTMAYWKGPFATEAEAKAAQNPTSSPTPVQAGKRAVTGAVSSILGLPALSHLRDLVIRSVKVVLGAALIIIGLAKLSGIEKIASNLPAVIPV
jgi:hypothetical protein